MLTIEEQSRLAGKTPRVDAGILGLLSKLLTAAVGAATLVAVLVFSFLAFIAVAVIGLMVGAYLWWKTRELRRQMRERPQAGRIIEGEATRESSR